jgi:hypothetical protein
MPDADAIPGLSALTWSKWFMDTGLPIRTGGWRTLRREHNVGHTNRAVSRSIPLWLDQLSFFAGQLGLGQDQPEFRMP